MALVDATRRRCWRPPRPSRTTPGSCRSSGARRPPASPIEVVSDGFGFFIRAGARGARGGASCRSSRPGRRSRAGGASIAFPNGHPTCHVCGTCKRNRVLAHQAAGRRRRVHRRRRERPLRRRLRDVVFAKRSLVRICLEAGWAFRRWTEFSEIDTWLDETLAAWRADPASLAGPRARPLFCGPEVWGEGLFDPPPGAWPPPSAACRARCGRISPPGGALSGSIQKNPRRTRPMAKYVFVTGGVTSSLGKGITAASVGRLLKARGLRVSILKLDPYINVDPGHDVARTSTARSSSPTTAPRPTSTSATTSASSTRT